MITLNLVLYVIAGVCLALAAAGVGHPRVGLFPLGMLFWLLADVLRL